MQFCLPVTNLLPAYLEHLSREYCSSFMKVYIELTPKVHSVEFISLPDVHLLKFCRISIFMSAHIYLWETGQGLRDIFVRILILSHLSSTVHFKTVKALQEGVQHVCLQKKTKGKRTFDFRWLMEAAITPTGNSHFVSNCATGFTHTSGPKKLSKYSHNKPVVCWVSSLQK